MYPSAYTFSWQQVIGKFGKKEDDYELQIAYNAKNQNSSTFYPKDKTERAQEFYSSLTNMKNLDILEFPVKPNFDKVTTAKQILQDSRHLFEPQTTDDFLEHTVPVKPLKGLQGLPEELIQKVMAKEGSKSHMFRDKERQDKIKQMRRLPPIARKVHNVFTSETRVALPFDYVFEKVVMSYSGHISKDVLLNDLRDAFNRKKQILSENFPDCLTTPPPSPVFLGKRVLNFSRFSVETPLPKNLDLHFFLQPE